MNNYLVINKYFHSKGFDSVYEDLNRAFLKRGEKLEIITNDIALDILTASKTQMTEKKPPILFFDKDINLGKILEKWGYRLINAINTIEICDDKAKTFLALSGVVEMPETILPPFTYPNIGYDDFDFCINAAKELGYPLIVKKNKGSLGQQVYLVKDEKELLTLIQSFNSSDFIFQKFIESSYGKDLRVYVVGGKCIAVGLRKSGNDFRSNVGSGGRMFDIEPPEQFIEIAEKAANAVNADFAGVDVLFGEKGPLVCEINSNAQFNALKQATKIDVADFIVDYYLRQKV